MLGDAIGLVLFVLGDAGVMIVGNIYCQGGEEEMREANDIDANLHWLCNRTHYCHAYS